MRLYLLLLFLASSLCIHAQRYSKVKIKLDETHTIDQLADMGFEVDHGKYRPGMFFINAFSESEVQQLMNSDFEIDILINDLTADFLERNKNAKPSEGSAKLVECDGSSITQYETPANYTYGSMGGYYTYQEMLDILDSMAVKYPTLFKAKQPITTAYTTHDGNTLHWVKISDNPDMDEDEPEVLITALHHAREPNSLAQMIFYMWYLLENYATNEEVKYIVDNTEMYFIPCINPDGYLYNESTNPNGGGFWRKNRRDNGDGTFGVDLNRNYPYEWAFDNSGSSPNGNSETYRGPSPGSEPETKMVMEFCDAHEFQIALNYHTFGNLLIYPWGFVDGATEDDDKFRGFAEAMTRENNYLAGYGSQTVGYTVNGDSDDWMYGEQTSKGKIFAMTPEVGPQFWPTQAEIDGLNKTTMTMNLTAAALLLNYGLVTPQGDLLLTELQGEVEYSIKKLGLKQGLLNVSLEPITNNILSTGVDENFGLFTLEESSGSINFALSPDIENGEQVQFNLVVDNGEYQWKTLIERVYSESIETAFIDPADDMTGWTTFGNWNATNQEFYSSPSSITDSPNGNYANNQVNETEMKEAVILENATAAYLSFRGKWEIESDYDYVQVLLSVDGAAPIPLCGNYTETGVNPQPTDEPVYDGFQNDWVLEEIDISQYLPADGTVEFKVSFRLFSDGGVTEDGFYFDDLKITALGNEFTSTTEIDASQLKITSRPNPARNYVHLDMEGAIENVNDYSLVVSNGLGQVVYDEKIKDRGVVTINTTNWISGVYHYFITDGHAKTQTEKFSIAK